MKAAQAAYDAARDNVEVTKAQQAEARAQLAELQTSLAKAERDLDFTAVRAPVDGTFSNRLVNTGDYVAVGQRLGNVVPLDDVFIDANFKETQLKRIRPGQPVTISVDAYGHRKFAGIVDSISPAAGSVFTLLPPDNATGNFTKIVQRLPVRIRVPKDVARQNLLRAGMSVYATVDTTDGAEDADSDADLDSPVDDPSAINAARLRRRRLDERSLTRSRSWPTPPPRPPDDDGRRALRAHRAAAAVCVPDHGVRHVHVDPGHPGRLGLAHRHPGRPVGELDRGVLGADRLSDRRSDRDPAVRIPVARARHAAVVCDFGRRLHRRELPVRLCLDDRADDPVARDPGISWAPA